MIQYFNRVSQKVETEAVYGQQYLQWAYESKVGGFLTEHLFSKRWLSLLMGAYESSKISTSKIKAFIETYQIKMEDFEHAEYQSFNDFFIRKFKPGLRPFVTDVHQFTAGAEARYLGFPDLKPEQTFAVKGFEINLNELLKNSDWAARFVGGTFIIARLCPVDYHRFHFPVSGKMIARYRVQGDLHSVNPVVFPSKPQVFLKNEREVAIFETAEFGNVAMIEVGALGVGKIVQSAYSNRDALPVKFEKGQEKGYFLFGGSTVIWLIEKGKMKLSEDLAKNSAQGLETWIPLGQSLGEGTK